MHIVENKPATKTEPPVSFEISGTDIPQPILAFLRALYPDFIRIDADEDEFVVDGVLLAPREILRKIRADMTQEDFAYAIGISREHYSNIELGHRRITRKMAKQLAKALNYPYTLFYKE